MSALTKFRASDGREREFELFAEGSEPVSPGVTFSDIQMVRDPASGEEFQIINNSFRDARGTLWAFAR